MYISISFPLPFPIPTRYISDIYPYMKPIAVGKNASLLSRQLCQSLIEDTIMAKTVFTTDTTSTNTSKAVGFININGAISISFNRKSDEEFLLKFDSLNADEKLVVLTKMLQLKPVTSVWIRSRDEGASNTESDLMSLF